MNETKLDRKKELNIEYELDANDILVLYLYIYEGSPQKRHVRKIIRRASIIGLCLILCGVIILIFAVDRSQLSIAITLEILAALAFLWLLVSPYFTRKVLKSGILKKYSQGQNKLTGKHKFSITPKIMIDSSDIGELKICWTAVDHIESTDQYIFIRVQGSGHHVIPRKAFSNDSAYKEFVDLANFHHQKNAYSTKPSPRLFPRGL
jgi:hypothetical protein